MEPAEAPDYAGGSLPFNPFATADVHALSRVRDFERRFRALLADEPGSIEQQLGQLLLSAILYGGLIAPECWQPWLRALTTRDSGRSETWTNLTFDVVSADETGSPIRRRWFADPVTRSLLNVWRSSVEKPNVGLTAYSASNVLARARELVGVRNETDEVFRSWFVPGVELRMRLQIPAILADHAKLASYSQPPRPLHWALLGSPCKFALTNDRKKSFVQGLPAASAYDQSYAWDKSGSWPKNPYIQNIAYKIEAALASPISTNQLRGARRANARAVRKGIFAFLERAPIGAPLNVREAVAGLFYLLATSRPPAPHPRLGTRTLGTLRGYLTSLGRVDWSALWMLRLSSCERDALHLQFRQIIEASHADKGAAYGVVHALERYIRYYWSHVSALRLDNTVKVSRPPAELISGKQFAAILALLELHPGGPRDAAMCRLAAMLMFRAGLRPAEVRYLRIGSFDQFGEFLELVIRTTDDAATKTRTSYRRLPLDVLLEADERAELLDWRARRVVETHGQSLNLRLFDDTGGSDSGLSRDRLLLPIEHAIAVALAEKPERRVPWRTWALGGALRHCFGSYLLATLLLPADAGGLELPGGIDQSLVSATRKRRVSDRLLSEGRLGQSAVHAVSTLMGHAHISRLLTTYAHLMDWSLAAHLWRWSAQVPLEPEAIVRLSQRSLSIDNIRKTTQRRCAKEEAAILDSIAVGMPKGFSLAPPPGRQRRGPGRVSKSCTVNGSAFVDHFILCDLPEAVRLPTPFKPPALPPVESFDLLCALLSMAQCGMALAEVAQLLGVTREVCENWLCRAEKLGSLGSDRHRRILKLSPKFPGQTHGAGTARTRQRGIAKPTLRKVPPAMKAAFASIDHDTIMRTTLQHFLLHSRSFRVAFRSPERAESFCDGLLRLGVPNDMIIVVETQGRTGSWADALGATGSAARYIVRLSNPTGGGSQQVSVANVIHGMALIAIGSKKMKLGIAKLGRSTDLSLRAFDSV